MSTLEYYNNNAIKFIDDTKNVDLENIQKRFMNLLSPGSVILDLGCGSGRDTKVFLENGFIVNAVDGSEEICKIVSQELGIEVKCMLFSEIDDFEKYDGVFACASLLHVERNELPDILKKIANALKKNGILYMSFKYGNESMTKDGKHYTNLNENEIKKIIDDINCLSIREMWISMDSIPGREQKWINTIIKKR